MTFYRLETPDGGAPVDGMCAITARRAVIVETISDQESEQRLMFDRYGFAPEGWIWFPCPA